MKQSHVLILCAAIALALAGCKEQSDSVAATAAPEVTAPAAAPAAPPRPDALKADQVSIALALESQPRIDAEKGVIEIPVKVTNNGSVALSGQSNPAVNIGVQVVGSDGTTASEGGGVRDFSRTPLPVIEPGASATVLVVVQADARSNGRKLKLDLVQEGVAWFSNLGQPVLEVGPFEVKGQAATEVAADPNMRSL